jgi:nicotinamide phosphoribosyltransferase
MFINPLTRTDFYKVGHINMYPSGTTVIYSNFTPRSSSLASVSRLFDGKVVFFGLQGVIKEFLIRNFNEGFFNQSKEYVIAQYKRRLDLSLGEGVVNVDHIAKLHDLGYLPIKIKALPEGSRVNVKVPVFTITNTHPDFAWLTNYLESALSAELWKPITSATTAYEFRKLLCKAAEETGANKAFVDFQCHDFSFRGMSGTHDAAISGAGHLLSFLGTDTIPAIDYLEEFYGADQAKNPIGFSVPATEHSVACANIAARLSSQDDSEQGRFESEKDFIKAFLKQFPEGIVSYVSDTYDYWRVITEILPSIKDEIIERTLKAKTIAKFVIRPDSGDPVKIICGELNGHGSTPSEKGTIQCLWEIFGGTVNDNGYKVLSPCIGVIYGDSITLDRATEILDNLRNMGFSSENIVFGIGSYTYQHVTRDSFGFAMKATYAECDGKAFNLCKDPKTGNGAKKSAKGLLRVEKIGDDFVLFDQQTKEEEEQGELSAVFLNGMLVKEETLSSIKNRLNGIL